MNEFSDSRNTAYTEDDIMDREELQRQQDRFCRLTNLFAYCLNGKGRQLTEISGRKEYIDRIKRIIVREDLQDTFHRISENSIEDQVIENTIYGNVKVAAISVRTGGADTAPALFWIVAGVLSDIPEEELYERKQLDFPVMITQQNFYDALDLLRDISFRIYQSGYLALSADAMNVRAKETIRKMENSLKRMESLSAVIQMLESDDSIEHVIGRILEICGTYLQIGSCRMLRVKRDKRNVVLIGEWQKEEDAAAKGMKTEFSRGTLFSGAKPLVLGTDSLMSREEREELNAWKLKAIVIIPIDINNEINIYVSFNEHERERNWSIEEVKYMHDAVKIMQSILIKRIQKNSLAGSYSSLEAILDNVGSAIYVKDMETGSLLFANKTMKKTFEVELKEGTLENILCHNIPDDREYGKYEVHYETKNRWYDLYFNMIHWVDGRKVTLCSIYEITDKKVYQQKIEQQAYTDFLTGLYNRMCCERDLDNQIKEALKNGTEGALLYLDLDDFKHINDGLGHQYGDVLLKAISHSLKRIDGIGDTCYRMGGDEFVIIIPPAYYDKYDTIVEGIKSIFNKPWFLKDADYYCTMSMGVVRFPTQDDKVQGLIKKADIAMYEAKRSGKNRVACYSDSIGSGSSKRLDMEKNMREATTRGFKEFLIYYQPIIDNRLPDKPCTGAEALIRWNSAELGFIPPADFIPLAEYLGLINPIGNYVLEEACRCCKEWNDNGKPNYKVNVNLSVVQLLQADIVDIVDKTLKETGINPRNLTLEVTESLAINDMERMKDILASIKKLGVRIALDDFGTGYSALSHIREIPFDVIKVDQSFVKDLAEGSYSQSFIKMVSELADAIDVNVCVEGIETEEQYRTIEGMKVRLIQGYYFGRPMTRKDFEAKYVYTQGEA